MQKYRISHSLANIRVIEEVQKEITSHTVPENAIFNEEGETYSLEVPT